MGRGRPYGWQQSSHGCKAVLHLLAPVACVCICALRHASVHNAAVPATHQAPTSPLPSRRRLRRQGFVDAIQKKKEEDAARRHSSIKHVGEAEKKEVNPDSDFLNLPDAWRDAGETAVRDALRLRDSDAIERILDTARRDAVAGTVETLTLGKAALHGDLPTLKAWVGQAGRFPAGKQLPDLQAVIIASNGSVDDAAEMAPVAFKMLGLAMRSGQNLDWQACEVVLDYLLAPNEDLAVWKSNLKVAEGLWNLTMSRHSNPTKLYVTVLDRCYTYGLWEEALLWHQRMRQHLTDCPAHTWATVLTIIARHGHYDALRGFIATMRQCKPSMAKRYLELIVYGLARLGRPDLAESWLDGKRVDLELKSEWKERALLESLIAACGQTGDAETALKTLDKMEVAGMSISSKTYERVLGTFRQQPGYSQAAEDLVSRMTAKERNQKLSSYCYRLLFEAFAISQDGAKAAEWLEHLQNMDIKLHSASYVFAMQACWSDDPEQARHLPTVLDFIIDRGILVTKPMLMESQHYFTKYDKQESFTYFATKESLFSMKPKAPRLGMKGIRPRRLRPRASGVLQKRL